MSVFICFLFLQLILSYGQFTLVYLTVISKDLLYIFRPDDEFYLLTRTGYSFQDNAKEQPVQSIFTLMFAIWLNAFHFTVTRNKVKV